MSLAAKVFAAFIVSLATYAGTAIWMLASLGGFDARLDTVRRSLLPLSSAVEALASVHEQHARWLELIGNAPDPATRRAYAAALMSGLADPEARVKAMTRAQALAAQLGGAPRQAKAAAQYGQVLVRIDGLMQTHAQDLAAAANEIFAAAGEDAVAGAGQERATPAWDAALVASKRLDREFWSLSRQLGRHKDRHLRAARGAARSLLWLVLGIAIAGVAVGGALTAAAVRALRPLRHVTALAHGLGQGDFDAGAAAALGQDEVGELGREFLRMAQNLKVREAELVRGREEILAASLRVRQANLELANIKRYHENIVSGIRLGVAATDANFRLTSMNPAFSAIWGIDAAAWRDRLITALPGLAAQDLRLNHLRGAAGHAEPVRLEAVALPGERRVDIEILPFRDGEGVWQGVLLIAEDVTEALQAKSRLSQIERLAAVGRLTAQVAHEIRNPLSAIGLNAELLEEETGYLPLERRAQARAMLSSMQREIERLTGVTEEYLRLAKLPAPQFQREPVNTLVANLANFLEPELLAARVVVTREFGEVPEAAMDRNQIRQAFLNLIRNAIQSMPGGGQLRITTRPSPGGMEVVIADTGAGIAEADLQRIFDPFFSTKEGGTGLGLPLTRQIIADHGGDIRVASVLGKGTEVTVFLPAAA